MRDYSTRTTTCSSNELASASDHHDVDEFVQLLSRPISSIPRSFTIVVRSIFTSS